MNINPFLMLLALVAGFLYSWQFVVVRKVARDVPALAAGAVVATAAGATADGVPGYRGDPQPAPEPDPAIDETAGGVLRQARGWLGRLDEAKERLVGAVSAGRGEAAADETDPAASAPETPAPGTPAPGTPEAALPASAGDPPAGHTVKGDRKARLYLVEGDPDFDRAKPDVWFVDEQAALDAGFAHYVRRPRQTGAGAS